MRQFKQETYYSLSYTDFEELMYCEEHYPRRDTEPTASSIIPGCTFGPNDIQDQAAQMEAEGKQKWLNGYRR